MAELKGSILGKITGSIGNITGRVRNGKNYLASKPGSFTPGSDPASLERRERFRVAVQLAQAVVNNSGLKIIWNNFSPPGTNAYNAVMQVNYKLLSNNQPGTDNVITPSNGFYISKTTLEIASNALNVVLESIGNVTEFNLDVEKFISLFSVIYLSEPNINGLEDDCFVSISSEKQSFQNSSPLTFNIPLNFQTTNLLSKYQSNKIFCAVVTFDDKNNPVHHSITIVS